jgi:hypothetical protein
MVEGSNKRTRMNLSQTAKGLVQYEITAEYETPEESAEQLAKAIDLVKGVIESKGLKSVDSAA